MPPSPPPHIYTHSIRMMPKAKTEQSFEAQFLPIRFFSFLKFLITGVKIRYWVVKEIAAVIYLTARG